MVRFGYGFVMVGAWACLAMGSANAGTILAQISAEGGGAIADAVVYAIPASGPASASQATTQMAQENQEFTPFVLPVQVGTAVEFPNRDSFRHHVYSFSPAKPFELKLFSGKERQVVTFDKEGIIALGCNIHDNMLAYIYAVPTPYFAKTGENGKATIANLDAGTYTIKVWHPNEKTSSKETVVNVSADGPSTVAVTVALKAERKAKKARPKDQTDY